MYSFEDCHRLLQKRNQHYKIYACSLIPGSKMSNRNRSEPDRTGRKKMRDCDNTSDGHGFKHSFQIPYHDRFVRYVDQIINIVSPSYQCTNQPRRPSWVYFIKRQGRLPAESLQRKATRSIRSAKPTDRHCGRGSRHQPLGVVQTGVDI